MAGFWGLNLRVAQFTPDRDCLVTTLLGAVCRVSRDIQPVSDDVEVRFSNFMRRTIAKYFIPLASDTDVSFNWWGNKSSLPKSRIDQIRAALVDSDVLARQSVRWQQVLRDEKRRWGSHGAIRQMADALGVSGFTKAEWYAEPKFPRGINARMDAFKGFFGPLEGRVARVIYDLFPQFVKDVPVNQRAAYIRERMAYCAQQYVGTDYTSFEAMFTKFYMSNTNVALYEHMLKNLPNGKRDAKILRETLSGLNRINSKHYLFIVEAVRMSGEMDTSSANGFANLCFMMYVLKQLELEESQAAWNARDENYIKYWVAQVEGDDGILTCGGKMPTPQDFANLGFVVKEDKGTNPTHVAFCGIRACEDGTNIKDIASVLSKFQYVWDKYVYAKPSTICALYRCKALSLLYEGRNCPILHNFALCILRCVGNRGKDKMKRVLIGGFDAHQREKIQKAMDELTETDLVTAPSITYEARERVQEWFNIPVSTQLELEQHLDNVSDLHDVHTPLFDEIFPDAWKINYTESVYDASERVEIARVPNVWWAYNMESISKLHSVLLRSAQNPDTVPSVEWMRKRTMGECG